MFFISYGLYLYGMFFNEKGMFAGFFFRGWNPRQGANPCYFFKINVFRPATGLAVPPLRSTILALLAEAGMKRA